MQDLASKIITAVLLGKPVYIMADFDGTISEHVDNPALATVHPGCFAGLVRLQAIGAFPFLSTGRYMPVAEKLMTPFSIVVDSNKKILVHPDDQRLRFPIIATHGVQYRAPNGKHTQYDIGNPAIKLMEELQKNTTLLQKEYPGLFIEKKYGTVSINTKLMTDLEKKHAAYEAAKKLMEDCVSISPEVDGQPIFELAAESKDKVELEVRPRPYGKAWGLRHFINPEPDSLIIQLGDSFGEGGTDRAAAIMLNDKKQYTDGHVLFIKTRSNTPQPPDSPARAEMMFAGPTALSEYLNDTATRIEVILCSRPRMEKQLTRKFQHDLLR
jgi:trehalose-phosphatase